MKLNTCLFFLILLSPLTYAASHEAESQTPLADITISADEVKPISERGGEFTLFGSDGAVSLSDFRGKVVAVYFGYSQCPDVCPTNLALLSSSLKKMTEQELAQFQGIFISVDPGRDDPQTLAEYTQYFHPKIIGLSGAPVDLDPVVEKYGAYYEKTSYSNSAMIYGIAHTSEIYVINREGSLVSILPHATAPKEIRRQLRAALNQGGDSQNSQ